mgnify:CR=1 FL=1
MTTKQANFLDLYKRFIPDIDNSHGAERHCRSPFREDKHPSFSINIESGFWIDFGTNEGGNVVQFYARKQNISTKAAYKELKRDYGIDTLNGLHTDRQNFDDKRTNRKTAPPIPFDRIQRSIERLQRGSGYYPNFMRERFRRRKISLEICQQLSIGITDDDYTLFAYKFDDEGNCTHYKKVRHQDGAKNLYAFNSASGFFPISLIDRPTLVLCEGESDALCLISQGIDAVTATAGAGTFKREWAALFTGKNVIILYDNDAAGSKGAQNAVQYLSKTAQTLAIAQMPEDYKDVCSFFEGGGSVETLHRILLDAVPQNVGKPRHEEIDTSTNNVLPPYLADDTEEPHKSIPPAVIFTETGRLIHRAVAENIIANNKICTSEVGSKTIFYEYSSGFWRQVSRRVLRRLIQDAIGDIATNTHIQSVLEIIADRVHIDAALFDTRDDLINLRNCAFNLERCVPIPHDSSYYFTHANTYNFEPNADCPKFHKALRNYSMHDESWVQTFWEILGYALTGKYEFQKMFWFFGGGANGKGTVLRVMQNLVGAFYTRASIKAEQLNDQFYKSGLINKRLAIAGEIPPKLANISAIKELSGGDRQSTDVKFGQQVDFENKAKLVFAMNKMPTFPANEPFAPILRRICLLPFEYRITTIDPGIEQQFEAELPGIFNHAIRGLQRLRKQQAFTLCERGKKQLDLYAGEINPFASFIKDKCTFDKSYTIWGYELWRDYQNYMDENCGTNWQNNRENITTKNTFFREISLLYDLKREYEHCREKAGKMLRLYGMKLQDEEGFLNT